MGASSGTTVAGQPSEIESSVLNSLNHPGDVQVDLHGNIFVADVHHHQVLFWAKGASSGSRVAGTGRILSQDIILKRLFFTRLTRKNFRFA
jgi:hypothetical protein